MARKKKSNWDNMDPQKSSAAQFLTYVASVGNVDERYEIRYEDENIWMSQKMLAAVYGIEVNTINYHIKKIFADAELDEGAVIRKIRITGPDGKNYSVNHYSLQVIIALGFKIDNEKAIAFRKWANQIVTEGGSIDVGGKSQTVSGLSKGLIMRNPTDKWEVAA